MNFCQTWYDERCYSYQAQHFDAAGFAVLDFPLSDTILIFTHIMCPMYFVNSFNPYELEKSIWKDSKAQKWKILGRMFTPYMITTFCCLCYYCNILWQIYKWNTATEWKSCHRITSSAKNTVEIDSKSIEGAKTISCCLNSLIVKMDDCWSQWKRHD